MQIDNKDLLTLVKSFARANPLPLDKDEIKGSLAEAEAYLNSPIAYPGQTIKVLDDNGNYQLYIIQEHEETREFHLAKPEADVDISKLKKYIQVTNELPTEDKQTEVLYVLTSDFTGWIWTGEEYIQVFGSASNVDLSGYAKLDGAVFTGSVVLAADPIEDMEAATKAYVDKVAAAGGSDPAEAIQKAKEEAIEAANAYTNAALTWGSF